ncbi:MAG: Rid family detoxifying hydrolase [Oscillospiraceae bacterium]|jgi:2-iminobutanoate/2-iminopropanoate deaminase|nr:Rid family detoxifying hydrolase [Oscillospiraceae bacterium]
MKTGFYTEKGPRAIGPYCTAVTSGGMIFCSGMLGINPETGKLAEGGIEAQTAQSIANIRTVAAELGVSLDDAVKTTVFLTDMAVFPKVNAIYAEAFGANPPARTCVAVAALPMTALVEIEVIFAK